MTKTIGITTTILAICSAAASQTEIRLQSEMTLTGHVQMPTSIVRTSGGQRFYTKQNVPEGLRLKTDGTYEWRCATGTGVQTISGKYKLLGTEFEAPNLVRYNRYSLELDTPATVVVWDLGRQMEPGYMVLAKTTGRTYMGAWPKEKPAPSALRVTIVP